MHRRSGRSLSLAVVAVAALVAGGCGESVEDAEQALCADLASLRANVQTLMATNADTSVDEFKQARQNVRDSWSDVQDSARNLGDERFDEVDDAWSDLADTLDDVDSDETLAEAVDQLEDAYAEVEDAQSELVTGIDCTNMEAN